MVRTIPIDTRRQSRNITVRAIALVGRPPLNQLSGQFQLLDYTHPKSSVRTTPTIVVENMKKPLSRQP